MDCNKNKRLIRRHVDLECVLGSADVSGLAAISEILLDKLNDRLLANNSTRKMLLNNLKQGRLRESISDIAFEIRFLGSSRIVALLNGGVPASYDEVVRDVAKAQRIDFIASASTVDIEQMIYKKFAKYLDMQDSRRADLAVCNAVTPNGLGFLLDNYPRSDIFLGFVKYSIPGRNMQDWLILQALSVIVARVSQIRKNAALLDHEDFLKRLRVCL